MKIWKMERACDFVRITTQVIGIQDLDKASLTAETGLIATAVCVA